MVTTEEIGQFWETHHRWLRHLAWKRLPKTRRDHADDVVSEAFLSACLHRQTIENLKPYAITTICGLTCRYFEKKFSRERQFNPDFSEQEYSSLEDEIIESEIEAAIESSRLTRREQIIASLHAKTRRSYLKWAARGFRSCTHSERCESTRIRKAIAARCGVNVRQHIHISRKA